MKQFKKMVKTIVFSSMLAAGMMLPEGVLPKMMPQDKAVCWAATEPNPPPVPKACLIPKIVMLVSMVIPSIMLASAKNLLLLL